MNGDKQSKLSELMRCIEYGWDCMYPVRIKGFVKRLHRKKLRLKNKKELSLLTDLDA